MSKPKKVTITINTYDVTLIEAINEAWAKMGKTLRLDKFSDVEPRDVLDALGELGDNFLDSEDIAIGA